MRWMVVAIAGSLAACHPMHKVTVEATFDVAADGGGTKVTCLEATGGVCQLDFRGRPPLRATLPQGQTRTFDVGPGVPVCLEADAGALAGCGATSLDIGASRIRKSSARD